MSPVHIVSWNRGRPRAPRCWCHEEEADHSRLSAAACRESSALAVPRGSVVGIVHRLSVLAIAWIVVPLLAMGTMAARAQTETPTTAPSDPPSAEGSIDPQPRRDAVQPPGAPPPIPQSEPVRAEGDAAALTPEALEAAGITIGEIIIENGDVFDTELPEENNALFRLANTLHVETKPDVIRSQLLFKS